MTFPSAYDPTHLYFITASVSGWKHLFLGHLSPSTLPPAHGIPNPYTRIVLESLAWLSTQKKFSLFAFALMPSHLHAILKPEAGTIADVLQDFGSFTSHAMLKKLRDDGEKDLLDFFHHQRRDHRHQHSLWQDIQAKNIYSEKYLYQKMEYIHNNPVSKAWRLVHDRADFIYSSACFYDRGMSPIIEVTDIREWLCAPMPPRTAAEA